MEFWVLLADTDQERFKKIQTSIFWAEMNPERMLLAETGKAVKEACIRQRFSLLLCNWELFSEEPERYLAWLSQKAAGAKVILYGREASSEEYQWMLRYGVCDYVLQDPARDILSRKSEASDLFYRRLETAVARLYRKLCQEERRQELLREGRTGQGSRLVDYFRYTLRESRFYGLEEQKEVLRRFHLSLEENECYVLLLATGKHIPASEWRNKETLRQYMEWIFQMSLAKVTVMELELGIYLALFELPEEDGRELLEIRKLAHQLIRNAEEYAEFSLNCYVSEQLSLGELHTTLHKLIERDRENVSYQKKVFLVGKGEKRVEGQEKAGRRGQKNWKLLLETGRVDALLQALEFELHHQVLAGTMDLQKLSDLFQDVMQLFYTFLAEKGMDAHALLKESDWGVFYEKALDSTEDFLAFLRYAVPVVVACRPEQAEQGVTERVLAWLEEHLAEDCSRTRLARIAAVNEAYLSRRFRQDTGKSLTAYIREKRMELAKGLLAETSLPIGEIGLRCGYDLPTRFSETFRKETGQTPGAWRKDAKGTSK